MGIYDEKRDQKVVSFYMNELQERIMWKIKMRLHGRAIRRVRDHVYFAILKLCPPGFQNLAPKLRRVHIIPVPIRRPHFCEGTFNVTYSFTRRNVFKQG